MVKLGRVKLGRVKFMEDRVTKIQYKNTTQKYSTKIQYKLQYKKDNTRNVIQEIQYKKYNTTI